MSENIFSYHKLKATFLQANFRLIHIFITDVFLMNTDTSIFLNGGLTLSVARYR